LIGGAEREGGERRIAGMRALVLDAVNAPFALREVPDPVAGPGEAVARVLACGSGLTIQHIKAGRSPASLPRIIGHEIVGEITEVGAGMSDLAVGDPVTAYYYLFCGHCHPCLSGYEPLCENLAGQIGKACDGGYAEYIKLPARNFIRLPEGLDYRAYPAEVGVIADALATPYKVLRRGRVRRGDTVAVFGAGGGLGIHQILMAKWAGARVIAVDVASDKFEACRNAGADEVVDAAKVDAAEALADFTVGRGLDVAIDYVSSSATLGAAVQALAPQGRLVTLGGAGQNATIPLGRLRQSEKEVLASRYVSRAEVVEVLEIVARGEVWPVVTDIRAMEEAEELHALLEQGKVTGRAALRIG
jgi:D-arabinose 1-dehydrogenase-like Zn-dependent alcohol dehydrogenase